MALSIKSSVKCVTLWCKNNADFKKAVFSTADPSEPHVRIVHQVLQVEGKRTFLKMTLGQLIWIGL